MARKQLNYWGFSPAVDLQEEKAKILHYAGKDNAASTDGKENFLILGSDDGRHMLKTIASMAKHSKKIINIYFVADSHLKICRQLLFLHLFCEKKSGRSVLGTAEAFLEIFGNTQVRHSTHELIKEIAGVFRTLTDTTWRTALPFVRTKGLKHKVMNMIKHTYSSWYKYPIVDIKKNWEERLRRDLGRRYDCRRNLFDWDFHTTFDECTMIGLRKYLEWRETGVAFKCRESRYTCPNPTLYHQDQTLCSEDGYFGDIHTSPYLAYGIESDQKSILQKTNGVYDKTSEDISLHNVIQLLKNIEMLQPIQDRVRIYPLIGESSCMVGKAVKSIMNGHFDCIYLAHDFSYPRGLISGLLKENGLLLAETLRYAVVKNKECKKEHYLRIHAHAKETKLTQLNLYDFQKDPHIAFMKS